MEEIITMSADEAALATPAEGLAVDGMVAEETAPKKKKRKPVNQQKLQDNLWGWIFCIPLIVGTCWFVYSALIMAFLLSFADFETGGSVTLMECLGNLSKYVYMDFSTGATEPLHWYAQIFTETVGGADRATLIAMGIELNEMGAYLFNTVFYMIGIPIGMILSMFFAVCMSRDIKGGNVFRVLYYLPCVSSAVAIVYTFKIMFSNTGVINQMLGLGNFSWMSEGVEETLTWNSMTGSASTSAFMADPYWCQGFFMKLVIIIMSVWKGLGGTIILYIAGLSGVNDATKEAAQIDGANGWTIFWKVTMPDLYPVIFYNIVTSVIGGMQIYAEPEMLVGSSTGGGNVLVSGYVALIYKYGINQKLAGAGAAYGMFLAVIIFVLTLFQFWLDSRNKDK